VVEQVKGRRCRFPVGEKTYAVDIDWHILLVPENGSCYISAIARAIGKLDVAVLKLHPGLESVACWL
jgi:hypothetical protein